MARAVMFVLAALLIGQPAKAEDKPKTSVVFDKVAACRAIAAAEERLACYDREVATLDTAIGEKRVAVVDREEVVQARQSLFGFKLPSLRLFGGGDESDELKEVDGVIASVRRLGDGRFSFTLQDGAYWVQTDDRFVAETVKSGTKVTLKKGTFGSFFADFEKSPTVKVKREN